MSNAQVNKGFIDSLSVQMNIVVFDNIAKHYGINFQGVADEIYDEEAENIMEYITGKERAAIYVFYKEYLKSIPTA